MYILSFQSNASKTLINIHFFKIRCNECPTNSYSLWDPYDNSTLCQKCPIDAEYCQASNIILKDGFWRESKMVDKIYSCPLKGCSEKQKNKNKCVQGYIGPACSSCDYKKLENKVTYGLKGTECQRCSDFEFVYLFLVATIVFYIGYIHHSIRSQIKFKKNIIKLNYLRKLDLLFLSKTKQNGADTSVMTKIFLHYIQIFSASLDLYKNLPFEFHASVSVIGDPTKVTYNSYDCMFTESKIPQLWLNRYLVLWGQIITITCIILIIQKCINKKKSQQNRIKIYAIFLYFFYYPSHTKLLISLCICNQYGSKSFLLNDFLQECWTKEHIMFSVLLIYPITIIWVLGIPLLMIKKIKNAMKENKTQSIEYILSYYFIQQGYTDKYYYWEVVRMIQKFAIMASLSSSFDNQTSRLMVIMKANPFSSKPLMKLEILLTQIIIFSLFLQAILENKNLPNYLNIIFMIVNLLANVYGLLISIKQYLLIVTKRLSKSKIKKILLKLRFFKKIKQRQKVSLIRVSKLWKKLKNATLNNNQRIKIYSEVNSKQLLRTSKNQLMCHSEIQEDVVEFNEQKNKESKIEVINEVEEQKVSYLLNLFYVQYFFNKKQEELYQFSEDPQSQNVI